MSVVIMPSGLLSTDTVTALKRAQTISKCLNCIVEWDEGGKQGLDGRCGSESRSRTGCTLHI